MNKYLNFNGYVWINKRSFLVFVIMDYFWMILVVDLFDLDIDSYLDIVGKWCLLKDFDSYNFVDFKRGDLR